MHNPFNKSGTTLRLIIVFSLGLLACRLAANVPRLTATPMPTIPLSPTPLPSPTSIPPTHTPKLIVPPSPLPTGEANIAAPALPTPAFDFAGLAPFRQAILPEFAADVDSVATAGASRYYLEVKLEWPEGSSLSEDGLHLKGLEQVRYTNTENVPLSEVYFRLYPNLPGYDGKMSIDTVVVDGQPVQPELKAKNSALRVPLRQPLLPGAAADITLSYRAEVPGQTRQGYNIFSASENTIALAGFYPAIAVHDESGWNIEIPPPYGDATYLDTSLYRVELTLPEPLVVAASGSLLQTRSNPDGSQTLSLISGPMRDFYIAARADFAVISQTVEGTVVNSYYPPELAEGGRLALRYAADSLRVFNERFGRYPYAEFDVVATPTRAGGVEYPGVVVVSQWMYDDSGGFFEHATAHEVAHQWWYGMVGNDQVDDPWLDESLTNYSALVYWEVIEGPEHAKEIIKTFYLGPYEQAKSQGLDRTVMGPVADFSESEYGAIVYGKGPLFFNALRQEVGDETYFKIMQTYFTEYKYKIAQPDDLFAVIEQVSGRNVEPLVETWLQK
jgi:hypothetical protein